MRWFVFVCCLLSSAVFAEELNYNLVSLSAQAEREVPNDLMRVVLAVEHQDDKPSEVANKVNGDMRWALTLLKRYPKIKAQTEQYNTYPVYDKHKIKAWRASQQLALESEDFAVLSNVLRDLQARLQVKQMQFVPTKATRKKVEDELVAAALTAFNERADLVKDTMKAKSYKVLDLNINTQAGHEPIPYRQPRVKMAMSMEAEPAAAVQSGTTTMNVQVHGRVQLD